MKKNKDKKFRIAGIGEILWDILPSGRQLGGAPANFAYHISAQGHEGLIISKIGRDNLGKELIEILKIQNLSTDYIQVDEEKQTGIVEVIIDKENQPDYIIRENVAWDFIEWNHNLKDLGNSLDALCFGTLAQRSISSRNVIKKFIESLKKRYSKNSRFKSSPNFF